MPADSLFFLEQKRYIWKIVKLSVDVDEEYGGIKVDKKDYEQKLNDEIRKNIIDFYNDNKAVCNEKYEELTNGKNMNVYEEIKKLMQIEFLMLKSSVIILTANDFEKKILHLNAYRSKEEKVKHAQINISGNIRRPFVVNIYFFEMGGYNIMHMHAKETGAYTLGGAADLIRYVLKSKHCFPTAVISFGICFGNDYKQLKIGDTIIVKKLYPYFMSAKIKDKFFYVKDSNIFEIDSKLDAKIQHLKGRGKFDEENGIYYGNMITGEAVISNALVKEIFIEAATNQPVLGGEMEGYALFKECQGFDCLVPCLLVKSICDWGACKNIEDCGITNLKDRLQAYAAAQAYKVLEEFMGEDVAFFDRSIYEEVKDSIRFTYARERVYDVDFVNLVLNETVDSIFKDNTIIVQKCRNNKKLVMEILSGLVEENIVMQEMNKEGIYRLVM